MEKKILIVGAGKIGSAQVSEALRKAGIEESEVLLIENKNGIKQFAKELAQMRTLEVQRLLETDIAPIQECNYRNYQKENSQQGWKSRPKHKR